MSRFISRNPHCESGSEIPANFEIRLLIHPFTHRLTVGIPFGSPMRFPTTNFAPVRSATSKNFGTSSAACCPSPSIANAHSNPRLNAYRHPTCSAEPFPSETTLRITSAPALAAMTPVSSREPSSITKTVGTNRRTDFTTRAIVRASFRHGITAAHRFDQFIPPEVRINSATAKPFSG